MSTRDELLRALTVERFAAGPREPDTAQREPRRTPPTDAYKALVGVRHDDEVTIVRRCRAVLAEVTRTEQESA